jgi:uncharacterized damage-inducible protein DinB
VIWFYPHSVFCFERTGGKKLMKHLRMFCIVALLSLAVGLSAQTAAPAAKPTPAPQAMASPKPAPTLSGAIDMQLNMLEKGFVDAAEAMPEDKYNFSPESLKIPGADYATVRTFAAEVKHVATANYFFWSSVTGDPMPASIKGPNGPEELKTKAEIVKFLKDSFALGHKAIGTLTTQNATEMVINVRGQQQTRIFAASFPVAHAFDHYGQMVEYLRMNGVVPPASRQQN